MLLEIGPEFHCLEGYDKNSNVWKNKIRILMLIEIGPDYQSLILKTRIRLNLARAEGRKSVRERFDVSKLQS